MSLSKQISPSKQSALLADICHKVSALGYIPGRSGNISARTGAKNETDMLITPSGWSLRDLEAEHMVAVPARSDVTSDLKPSSEGIVHQAIYAVRPDVEAIIHAHPPKATALAISGKGLDCYLIPEFIVSLGQVPLIPYYLPGSDDLAKACAEVFKKHDAVILANHGVIVTGDSLIEALYNLELLENFADTYINASMLGNVNHLTQAQVDEVLALREAVQKQRQGHS